MKKKVITIVCLFGMFSPSMRAHYHNATHESILALTAAEEKLPLQIKKGEGENGNGKPNPRTLIPEVIIEDYTLHFITTCYGCTFRLMQNDTVCYSTEITGNTLTIPNTFTGTYELQIVSEEHIFYTNIVL